LGYVFEAYAALAVRRGAASESARLQGAASSALLEAGTALETFERTMAAQTTLSAVAILGLDDYGRERETGQRLGVEEALMLAQAVANRLPVVPQPA
jgi:hypothetical protein